MERSIAYLTKNLIIPLFHEKALEVIDQFFTEEVDVQTTFISGKGPNILKQSLQNTFEIFPDLHVAIHESIQNGNTHIYKWQAIGFHAGTIMGIPPSKKNLHFSGVVYGEMRDGYITKYHSFSNIHQVLQSLHGLREIDAVNAASILDNSFLVRKQHMGLINSECIWQLDNTEDLDKLHEQSRVSLIASANLKNNSAFTEIYQKLKKLTRFPLTWREFECLGTWIKGCSIKESARRMGGLSERTIQTYRESIKKKFGVCNYQQVLYIIKNNGLLPHLL